MICTARCREFEQLFYNKKLHRYDQSILNVVPTQDEERRKIVFNLFLF